MTLFELDLDDPPMAKLGSHDDPFGSSSGSGALGIIGEAFAVPVDESVDDFWLKIIKRFVNNIFYIL